MTPRQAMKGAMRTHGRRLRILDLCCGKGGWGRAFRQHGHEVIGLDYDPKFRAELTMDIREFARNPRHYLRNYTHEENWVPDIILVSPPCEGFSVSSIGKMWENLKGIAIPKHKTSILGLELLEACMQVIAVLDPWLWVIENPTAKMRVVLQDHYGIRPIIYPGASETGPSVSYCKYGKHYRKWTDLWTNRPDLIIPRPPCLGAPRHGLCEKTPSGWNPLAKGTQVEVRTGIVWLRFPDGTERQSTHPVYVLDPKGQPCHEGAARGAKTGIQGLKDPADKAEIPYELSLDVCEVAEAYLL